MKKSIIVLTFIFLVLNFLNAQVPGFSLWNNIRNSSYTADEEIYIRCETIELPGFESEIFYTTESGWENGEMTNLSGLTYEAIIPATPQSSQFCRFKAEVDTLVAMMPAFIANDIFPPNAGSLALVAEDPIGDTLGMVSPNLDMIGYDFGYSDSRFYTAIENGTGQYPTNNGTYPIEFYFYITTLLNPENVLIDSVIYAMIYTQNIPGLLSSGLYRMSGTEFSLEAFVQIGNIETDVVDGKLVMACDIEDLTEDEYFGMWPNISNSIGATVLTANFALPSTLGLADFAQASLQNIQKFEIESFENSLPQISDIQSTIIPGNTNVTFVYTDEDNNFPLTAEIIVNGTVYPMLPLSFDYTQPVTFETIFPITNWDEATIRISDDNIDFVEETFGFTIVQDDELQITNYELRNFPNPFNPSTTISFELTAKDAKNAKIEIYNLKGQKIKQFEIRNLKLGINEVTWGAEIFASGIYFYKLIIDDKPVAKRKMILLK